MLRICGSRSLDDDKVMDLIRASLLGIFREATNTLGHCHTLLSLLRVRSGCEGVSREVMGLKAARSRVIPSELPADFTLLDMPRIYGKFVSYVNILRT